MILPVGFGRRSASLFLPSLTFAIGAGTAATGAAGTTPGAPVAIAIFLPVAFLTLISGAVTAVTSAAVSASGSITPATAEAGASVTPSCIRLRIKSRLILVVGCFRMSTTRTAAAFFSTTTSSASSSSSSTSSSSIFFTGSSVYFPICTVKSVLGFSTCFGFISNNAK